MLLAFITINLNANSVTELIETTSNSVTSVIDTTKLAVITTVKTVDTSSNFKNIYSDLKTGLMALGSSLKVGAEHVYGVIVKQQIVKAITWLIIDLLFIGFTIILWIMWSKDSDKDEWWAVPVIMNIISLFIFFFTIDIIIGGFVNPEYGAMKDVVEFVQSVSDGSCKTCK